ncbi:HTH domain-containing protein [Ornithinimicrobium sp. Arc0846-15]|nr:HTH domain-containing protein [Ornithinimicrobium laminariae]
MRSRTYRAGPQRRRTSGRHPRTPQRHEVHARSGLQKSPANDKGRGAVRCGRGCGNRVRQYLVGLNVDIGDTDIVFFADGTAESRTRDLVQAAVSTRGPVTARELATEFDLTPAAVRRHLDALAAKGMIEEREVVQSGRRGRGRPARAYVLTASGQEQLPTTYDDVAIAALRFLSEHSGTHAVAEFADQQMAELEKTLLEDIGDHDDDVQTRTLALAEALSKQGYAASTRPVGQGTGLAGLQLCQGHCPMRGVANEFKEFCDAETSMISRVLGVHVQRLATLAGGEHVCTTFVPTGPMGSVPTPEERPSR